MSSVLNGNHSPDLNGDLIVRRQVFSAASANNTTIINAVNSKNTGQNIYSSYWYCTSNCTALTTLLLVVKT